MSQPTNDDTLGTIDIKFDGEFDGKPLSLANAPMVKLLTATAAYLAMLDKAALFADGECLALSDFKVIEGSWNPQVRGPRDRARRAAAYAAREGRNRHGLKGLARTFHSARQALPAGITMEVMVDADACEVPEADEVVQGELPEVALHPMKTTKRARFVDFVPTEGWVSMVVVGKEQPIKVSARPEFIEQAIKIGAEGLAAQVAFTGLFDSGFELVGGRNITEIQPVGGVPMDRLRTWAEANFGHLAEVTDLTAHLRD